MIVPTREIEKEYLAELSQLAQPSRISPDAVDSICLAGVDEVGRGALAGPVSVGIAVIDCATSDSFPATLRDSKQLSARAREALIEPCAQWVRAYAVGSATATEIDTYGIVVALRIAAARASQILEDQGVHISGVLLDGKHNWWSRKGLFETTRQGSLIPESVPVPPQVPVRTVIKGDAKCAVIAAASVFAKVARDTYMVNVNDHYPYYGWDRNKGYSSSEHIEALACYGASEEHRRSWHLPGVDRQ